MISTLIVGFVVIAGLLCSRLIFVEYPKSAIDTARNSLFVLRDELFEMGRTGVLRFESDSYIYHRQILNAMIRYAHDLSGLQLLFAMLTRKGDLSERRRLQIMARADHALQAMRPEARAKIERIMEQATTTMVQLLVTRSILLSTAFASVFFVVLIHRLWGSAKKHVEVSMASRRATADRNNVRDTIEEIMEHRPLKKRASTIIELESLRYFDRDSTAMNPSFA